MSDHNTESTDRIPTLADVARHAGVSTATVSRCLNAPGRVIEDTRKRVMKAVNELGYSPNFNARALASKRTNTFGAIIPTMDNAIFARGLQAFQEELDQAGITLLVSSSSYRPELEEKQIRTLVARGADALLLIGHHRDQSIYEFLERRGVPVLVTWAFDDTAPQSSIGFDNRRAMSAMAQEVIRHGHQRIGVISAPQANNDRARDRVLGVKDAMVIGGLDPDAIDLVETSYGIESGKAAFRELMTRPKPPTVIICGNDVQAVGALHMAHEMDLRVPQDVSITGFDDMELSRVARPPLTTVHVPHREMGQQAARLLISMVEGADTGESIRLDTSLRLRETLGPAPS